MVLGGPYFLGRGGGGGGGEFSAADVPGGPIWGGPIIVWQPY